MALSISSFDRNRLIQLSQLNKLGTNEYLTDPKNRNYIYIKKRYFQNETNETVNTLITGSGIFSSIQDTIAYYTGDPVSDYDYNLQRFVKDYVSVWFATMALARWENGLRIEYVPAYNYRNDNGVHKVLRFYVDEGTTEGNTMWVTTNYVLEQTFLTWVIENRLYRSIGDDVFDGAQEVPLDSLEETSNLEPVVQTGLDIPSLIVIKDDPMEQFPTSLFEKIEDVVYSIDRKIVMFDTQFLQNAESFVLFSGIRRPKSSIDKYDKGAKVNFSELWRIINAADSDSKIEFVNNRNELIQDAMMYEEKQIRKISAMTNVPVDFLGLDSAHGNIGKGSRSLIHGSFVKRIQNIRDVFDRYLSMVKDLLESEWQAVDASYSWPDIFAKSDNELVEELAIARTNGMISQLKSIQEYQWVDEEEAMREMEQINLQSNPQPDATQEEVIQEEEEII